MKKLLILLFLAPLFTMAQNGKYTSHTVAPKESLSSIGRLYNINPRELAKLNNIDYEKGLALGQVLKVPNNGKAAAAPKTVSAPATETKAPVKTVAASSQGSTPIYHTVAKKETLYHISTLYGKVPIANIKKWNNLSGDGLSEGARLIVGYTNSPAAEETKTTPVVAPAVVKTEPVKPVETPKAMPGTEPVKSPEVKTVASTSSPVTGKKFEGGFFKTSYAKSSDRSEETGMAGIFKSTSGWEDGKYYCLHNSATAGSIIKITNNATKKSVYARVLDVMPDLKQNEGLVLRISNAAAEELGAGSGNFECVVTY